MIELQNQAHASPLSQLAHHCLGDGPLATDFVENIIKNDYLKKPSFWDRIAGIEKKLRALQWRHNGSDGVPNHQSLDSLLNCLFRRFHLMSSWQKDVFFCTTTLSKLVKQNFCVLPWHFQNYNEGIIFRNCRPSSKISHKLYKKSSRS